MDTFPEGLGEYLKERKCDYCNQTLGERVIVNSISLKVYCSEGCSIWDEATDKGLAGGRKERRGHGA